MNEIINTIRDKVAELRVAGKEPKFVIVDQDTLYGLTKHGLPFIPAYLQPNTSKGDTIFGARVAIVRGSKPFLDVV